MARPLRNLYTGRPSIRRRHRSWGFSMTMATAGWAVWGLSLVLQRALQEEVPPFWLVWSLGALFAAPGLLAALLTIRGSRGWLTLAMVPIIANGMLLLLPWLWLELPPSRG